ncbi:MAG TPA: FtsX-like permease family protein [Candidatus Acidoferrales bacterium]
MTRRREMALRVALGARKRRLIRQTLTETLVLALIGGALGIVLGTWTSVAASAMPMSMGSNHVLLNFRFDWRVFAYALGAAVLAGSFMGIAPALRSAGINLNDFLHDGGHSGTGRRKRARNTLVIAQVAVSLMLLIVAGLFARSLTSVQHTDLGFEPAGVLNLSMNPNEAGYNESQSRQFVANLLERVRSVPGVESASLATAVPFDGIHMGVGLQIDGYQAMRGQVPFAIGKNAISSQYFATMGIPIIRGRGILDSDRASTEPVSVINQGMAEKFWPGQDPIGKLFTETGPDPVTLRVIGVVKDCKIVNLITPSSEPYFYVPLSQDQQFPASLVSSITLQIRIANPSTITHGILDLIRTLAPTLPVFGVQTMTQAVDTLNGLLLFKIAATIAGSLGVLGLVLAVVGVYGVVSYSANQRVREIGIRTALGAQPDQVLRMILWQGFKTVGIGLIAGVVISLALGRLVGTFLVGVSAFDPLTYLGVTGLLSATALFACYIPARRAMRVDPMVALRHE